MKGFYAIGAFTGYEVHVDKDGEHVRYRYHSTASVAPERKAKVKFTQKGRAYFLASGKRIHLDECFRSDI